MESKDWSGFGYFRPDLEKNETVSGMFLTAEHLRGHWKCNKSIFLASRAKRRMWGSERRLSSNAICRQSCHPPVIELTKIYLEGITFFCRETRGF